MERLSHNDIYALNNAIGEIYSARDMESFYRSVFSSIRGIIPSELSSFNEVEVSSPRILNGIHSSNEHHHIFRKLLPVFNEHCHEHPFWMHFESQGVVKSTDLVTRDMFKGLALYNEYYRHVDIDTQVVISLEGEQGGRIFLALSRKGLDFSERNRLILTLLRPHIINALRIVRELGLYRNEALLLERVVEKEGRGVIVFGPEGRIEHITSFASELLSRHTGEAYRAGDILPEVILDYIRREIASPVLCPERRALSIENGGNRLQARLVRDAEARGYMLLLTAEKVESPLAHTSLGLTERESETLYWVAKGKTNLDIAYILRVSERTVEKHLEHIYAKLGVETRTAAAAMVMK